MISVIIPVYKVEKYLCRCIDSVLGQTCQDFEVILVDDGSPDNCGAICDAYAEKDNRIHVIHQKNAGVSAARNVGIEYALQHSDSKWIAFIDSDDWIHKQYLQCLLEAAEKTGSKLSICDRLWVNRFCEDAPLEQAGCIAMDSEDAFVQAYPNCTPPWGKLIEKSLLRELRFPVGVRYEDARITHLLTLSVEKVAICPEKLYYYYNNDESYTRTAWTDARMDSIAVHEERLIYFRENGYEKAYLRELEEYIERVTSHLSEVSDILYTDTHYADVFEVLRAKLRQAVAEGESRNVCSRNRKFIMTYAYVAPSDVVWRSMRQLQRLWRRIRKP